MQLTLGEQLRIVRRAQQPRLSITKAAEIAGVTKATLLRVERDERDPQLYTLMGIAKAYGVHITITPDGVIIKSTNSTRSK
jgi:transcriptional regulator with XRE-family HTH domain